MLLFPNAKINLGLNIVSKRKDGYHNLETIFYPIPIQDALEIIEDRSVSANGYQYSSSGIEVGGAVEKNLCVKAFLLLKERYALPNIKIHLHKNIPMGGGLGGGSADASFVLLGLNDMFNLNLSKQELIDFAVKLGADCPFFITNEPSYGHGIGELLEPVNLSLEGCYMVILNPNIHISTADAFGNIEPKSPTKHVKDIIVKPRSQWRDLLINDFEKAVFSKYPQINDLKKALYSDGAFYASMSGSGSSVFALFEEEPKQIKYENFIIWKGFL